MDVIYCKDRLSSAGVIFDAGLTAEELSTIERQYGFKFPPDLPEFLACALPVSHGWVDWRRENRADILERLEWPSKGMCFDVEHNSFWMESWGVKPEKLADACAIARMAVERAPRLIPICGHRYLPDSPCESGNPVFSVFQTDIIYYGADFFDYLCNEYFIEFGRAQYVIEGPVRHIEFWSDLVGR